MEALIKKDDLIINKHEYGALHKIALTVNELLNAKGDFEINYWTEILKKDYRNYEKSKH